MRWSIQRRIVAAFGAIGLITIGLGLFAVDHANRSASLVRRTYDETVIVTSYARAAAADFANMRASFAHEAMSPANRKDVARQMSAALAASFQADLATALEKSSADTGDLGPQLRAAVAGWVTASEEIGPKPTSASWDHLERQARKVEELLESFVSRVSDRGYAYRQEAQATMGHDVKLTTLGVATSLAIAGFVALMLYLRISAPIGAAARFANDIASGTLDGRTPAASTDEIGDLIRAMVSMRTDIGAMMGEQVVLRQQSQARVAEALEGSQEGVVIVDADGTIQIANQRALDFLGLPPVETVVGTSLAALLARMRRDDSDRSALLTMAGAEPEAAEMLLPDGRWIQNSRNRTTEGGLVALYADITSIRDQTVRLATAHSTLDAALGNMSQGLCVFDADSRLTLANSRFHALFGVRPQDLVPGIAYEDMVARALGVGASPDSIERAMRYERLLIRRRRGVSRSVSIRSQIFAIAQQPMPDGGWIATYEDITERRRAESQIAFMANHDALTRLPNRTLFGQRVEASIARAKRGVGFAVLCLDLDRFKQVNDSLGHAVGDLLLLAVSDRLTACIRETDTVARLGGDEFAILQADVSEPTQVMSLTRRIVESMAAPFTCDGHELAIGISIGVAIAPGDGLSHGQLLKNADNALYKAKDDGRGTWHFFEAAMDETLQQRNALESDLRQAIARNEFEVHYQPLFDVRNERVGSFEALVRWRHPTRGLVTPDVFIPLAEETRLIKAIGAWVLRTACAEAAGWPSWMRLAVNVSAIQLREASFVATVSDTLAETGLRADRLELEVTETVLLANHAKVLPILTALRSLGIRFSLDDFGTGYSSLSTLRAFPFDKIKIDRSFVRDVGADEAADQIIRTILALGHSLNMSITAEGVETAEQLRLMVSMGCEDIQGYHIGRPTPAAALPALLAGYTPASLAA